MGGTSVAFAVDDNRIKLAAFALMAIGCMTLLSIKTCPED
jgi:hypothetical protein